MKLPSLKAREVEKILRRAGFEYVRQKGSHRIYVKGHRAITLPWHSRDVRPGTLRAIIKQSGLSESEFLALR